MDRERFNNSPKYYKDLVEKEFETAFGSSDLKPDKAMLYRVLKIAENATKVDAARWNDNYSFDKAHSEVVPAKGSNLIRGKDTKAPDGWINPDLGTPEEIEKQNKDLEATNEAAKAALAAGGSKISSPIPEPMPGASTTTGKPSKTKDGAPDPNLVATWIMKRESYFYEIIDILSGFEEGLSVPLINRVLSKGLSKLDRPRARRLVELMLNDPIIKSYIESYINQKPQMFDINFDIDDTIEQITETEPQPEESNAESNQA